MALLGMGANMQYNGHFPGYCSTRDLIFGAEGSSWTLSNGDTELMNGPYQIVSLPLSSSCHLLAYNKELLKRTILKHEAIFRDQIHELHRVYQKQRELMDEIKRNEFYKQNLRLETSWSSSSLCYSSNLPWLTGQSSFLIAKSIQLPLASGQENSRQTCPINHASTAIKEVLEDSKPSESTYRKVGNKILDLQLPADEYIDSEDDSLENERVTKMPQLSSSTLNGISQVVCNSDEKPYGASYNGITDLNEPFKLEEETSVKSDDLGAPIRHGNSTFPSDVIQNSNQRQDLSISKSAGKNGGVLDSLAKFNATERQCVSAESLSKKLNQVDSFPCFQSSCQIAPASLASSSASHDVRKHVKGSEDTARNINLNIMPSTAFQSIEIAREECKFEDSRLPWLKEKPVPQGKPNEESKTSTQIEPVLLNPYESEGIHCGLESNKIEGSDLSGDKTLAVDINGKTQASKVCQNLSKSQCIEDNVKIPDVNSTGKQFMENKKTKHEHLAGIIDLNSCMNEDENTLMDIDCQAPASPENKECSPPRGESDENQVEMPFQLAGQEDPEGQEEQARMAAQALVSISGVAADKDLQVTTCPPSESFVSSPLQWFAGIVSTIADHSENEVKVDGTANDLEQYLPADFDYFEFMTLNLTEKKVLDCCYKGSGQTEQEGGSTSPTQPRKSRMNRGRRQKDFQSEILPSLASLSRYEVTEDLQTIGGLVEAAGTRTATSYARSAGRNVLAKGRRKSSTSAPNITELLLNLKQLKSNTELSIEKRCLISWGKVCRKRRGQRFPISNPPVYFKSST